MSEIKITELPVVVGAPNDTAVVPCVLSGVTRKLSLSQLKDYLEIPTEFVTLITATSPITVSPANGIVGEGTIGILPATTSNSGSMSSSQCKMLVDATSASTAGRLVLRDSSGNYEANNITLRAPDVDAGSATSGTITGNLNQRLPGDTGVNAKLGSNTRYFANVTSLNASEESTFQNSLNVTGILKINTNKIVLTGSTGASSFSGDMSVGGNITLGAGKQLSGSVNASGDAFTGRFTDLTSSSLTVGNFFVLQSSGDAGLNKTLNFDNGRAINLPSGTLNCQTINASGTISAGSFSGNITGNSGSTDRFSGNRTISLTGIVGGVSAWDGSGNLAINTYITDGSVVGADIAENTIHDSRLQTIQSSGKVSNSATSANSNNVGNTIVLRDGNGDFNARFVNATLNGTSSSTNGLTSTALSQQNVWANNQYFKANKGANVTGIADCILQAHSDSGHAAAMSFHIAGRYAVNLGLDNGLNVTLGGWSDGPNYRWTCDPSGNFTARGNVTAYSDERLKAHWKNLSHNIIEQLQNVKTGTYLRTDSNEHQVGVSAQDLKKIIPEAVQTDPNGYLTVAYGNAALALCVELAKKIVSLEATILEIKQKLS